MAAINIYKIAGNKHNALIQHLRDSYQRMNSLDIEHNQDNTETGEVITRQYRMTLYYWDTNEEKPLSWNWVLQEFGRETISTDRSPKAVVLIENDTQYYAVTLGHSYFKIDQFSDKEWAFSFARRLEYSNVRTIAITNPNSQRNKTVNTYLDFESLDVGSGEALTKLKAKVVLPEDFPLFSDTIEIGNAIRLSCQTPSLQRIAEIIHYIDEVISTQDERVRIPYFREVKDDEQISNYETQMMEDINNNIEAIDFSEYQIFATRIVFRDNYEYELRHGHRRSNNRVNSISVHEVETFLHENGLTIQDDLMNVRVIVYREGTSIYQSKAKDLIYYTNEQAQALFADGRWFVYNEDYLHYLAASISEIEVEYDEQTNYSRSLHNQYLDQKYQEEFANEEYVGLSENVIRNKIRNKYYRERYFNNWLIDQGYSNFDRDLEQIGRHRLEVMDLFRDRAMYAVKFGKSSGHLCYAVDQSLAGIHAYHRGDIQINQHIEEVYIWLVLERGDLPVVEDRLNLNALNMLILKNKLDNWKKEVRLLGYRPKIRINYSRE